MLETHGLTIANQTGVIDPENYFWLSPDTISDSGWIELEISDGADSLASALISPIDVDYGAPVNVFISYPSGFEVDNFTVSAGLDTVDLILRSLEIRSFPRASR